MARTLVKRTVAVENPLPPSTPIDTRPEVLNVAWVGDNLQVVERDPDGVVRIRSERAPYVCFISASDAGPEFLRAMRNDRRVVGASAEGAYYRIQWRDRDTCLAMCGALHAKGIATFEGDINPVRRWMTDHKPRQGRHRIAYLDLETDSRVKFSQKERARILCWAVIGEDGSKKVGVLEEDTDAAERLLLGRLLGVLNGFDLVAAWNGDRFDFPVLDARLELHRVPFTKGRWLWLDQLALFQRMNSQVAESGDEKVSFKLNDIAHEVLGEGKADLDAAQSWQHWAAGGEDRRRLVRYCVQDTDLLRRIEEARGHIGLLQTLAETCNVFPDDRGVNPTIQAEGFLLALGAAQGYRFPTVLRRQAVAEKYKGAFVMQPQVSGIAKNVHVGDFSGLYPSIIVTWNMSPETLLESPEATALLDANRLAGYVEWRRHHAWSPLTGCYFRTDKEGILPHAVKEVMRLRKHWNKLKASLPPGTEEWVAANRKATAYKVAANSFYGVMGSPMSRFFCRGVAESTSQCGAHLIVETMKRASAKGMTPAYGDTDSLFVVGANRTEFEVFVQGCNADFYPGLLAELGCKENLIELAYEKEFERLVFVAAKKYAGRYVHFKGSLATTQSKPEVKGLEYKRGDSIRLARQFQAEAVDLLVGMVNGGVEDPAVYEEMVGRWQTHILHGNLELADVVIRKSIQRELDAYAVRTKKDGSAAKALPHIEIAKRLKAQGQDMGEGAKVGYFVFDASGPETVYRSDQEWTGQCDRFEVWEKLVWPPTERLLAAAFPGHDWSAWGRARPRKGAYSATLKARMARATP